VKPKEIQAIAVLTGLLYGIICVLPSSRQYFIFAAIISVLLSESGKTEKPILFGVGVLGLAPVLGWIGSVNASVDVVGLIAVVTLSSTLVFGFRKKMRIGAYVIPGLIVGWFTYIWWRPVTRGTLSEVLARLLGGWDHFGHYYLLISAKVHHKFVALLPNQIPGTTIYDRKYPAGIHMSWAQWWRDKGSELIRHPEVALHQYFISVVITVGICTSLIIIAISRVSETPKIRILASTAVGALFLSFICFGHLSMAIWSGFPNFIVAITGAIIIGSISIHPSKSEWSTLIGIAGAAAMTSYNWYPLLIPVAPIALYTLWNCMRSLHGKSRQLFVGMSILLGVAIVAPVSQAISFGADHLAVPGGINSLPIQGIVLVLLLGLSLGLIQISRDFSVSGCVKASPLILAGVFQLLVTVPIRISDGTYPYYPQKIAYGMVFIVLAYGAMSIFQWLDERWKSETSRVRFIQGISVLVACCALSQIFGYVGVDWSVVAGGNTAPGIPTRDLLIVNSTIKNRIASLLLELQDSTEVESLATRDCLVLDDTEMQEYDPVLVNYWVGTLTWSLTEEHIVRAQNLIPIRTGTADYVANATVLDKVLSPDTDCPVVIRPVASALVARNPQWIGRVWAIESDGHITKFVKKD
jgi:hypothetical protein